MAFPIDRYELPSGDVRTDLAINVTRALQAVPIYFKTAINIEGISATDLFAINSILGGAIEQKTVEALNGMREIWDPRGKLSEYQFNRYPESFPDVRLEKNGGGAPLIGVELKGWFMLSKEEVPSFRFRASSSAMTVWDLIAVFPWSLSNVLTGKPELKPPFVEQAKYAADLRTYYWEHRSANSGKVVHPDTHPYPEPRSSFLDSVSDDRGGNFGRIARIKGLMEGWVEKTMETQLAGIEARWWVRFLKMFSERSAEGQILKQFEQLSAELGKDPYWAHDKLELIRQIFDGK